MGERMTTRTFTMFRRGDLSETHDENQRPPSPDGPAFWGVVWPDGTCTLRWAGVVAGTSVWASFEDAMKVHGHFTADDKHDSLLVWDGMVVNAGCPYFGETHPRYGWCDDKCGGAGPEPA